jgi:hypothetical protein
VALLLGEQHVPDVARRGRKSGTAGLSPGGLVDLVFVANRQITGYSGRDKDSVAHFSAGMTVRAVDLFPQLNPPQLKLGQFFFDFSAQTVFLTFSLTFLPAGEHPQSIAPASYQKYPAALHRYEL